MFYYLKISPFLFVSYLICICSYSVEKRSHCHTSAVKPTTWDQSNISVHSPFSIPQAISLSPRFITLPQAKLHEFRTMAAMELAQQQQQSPPNLQPGMSHFEFRFRFPSHN